MSIPAKPIYSSPIPPPCYIIQVLCEPHLRERLAGYMRRLNRAAWVSALGVVMDGKAVDKALDWLEHEAARDRIRGTPKPKAKAAAS